MRSWFCRGSTCVTDSAQYNWNYNILALFGNLVFAACAAMLAGKARGYWRKIYTQLAAAGSVYAAGRFMISAFIARGEYSRVSLRTLPMFVSFLMLGTAGMWAYLHVSEEGDEIPGPAGMEIWKTCTGGRPVGVPAGANRLAVAAVDRLLVHEAKPGPGGGAFLPADAYARRGSAPWFSGLSAPGTGGRGAAEVAARLAGIAGQSEAAANAVRAVGKTGFARPVGGRRRS